MTEKPHGLLCAPRVTEATHSYRNVLLRRFLFNKPSVDPFPCILQHVERNLASPHGGVLWATYSESSSTSRSLYSKHPAKQQSRDRLYLALDVVHADSGHEVQAEFNCWDPTKVDFPIFKCRVVSGKHMQFLLYRRLLHCPTSKPWLTKHFLTFLADYKRTETSRVSEQLVERDGDEMRLYFRKIQLIGRGVCHGVEEHVLSMTDCFVYQAQCVFHSGEVRLRPKRKQTRPPL